MATLDATVNTSNGTDEKPTHYANIKIASLQEDGSTIYEPLGKYGVGLLASRDIDAYLAELSETDPQAITTLDVRLEIRPATAKKRNGAINLVARKDIK